MENIELKYASSIENVDYAFYDWLDVQMNLSCDTKSGLKKVPVLWVTPERAFQIKQNKEFRDVNGTLNVPLITVERVKIEKDQKNNATFFNSINPNDNRIIISRKINQKKTSEFNNAYTKKTGARFISKKKGEKTVYEYTSMLLPIYATFTYTISVFTQFQQQMNELLQPFITKFGSTRYFLIERNGYKYECFIEPDFDTKNNVSSMEEEERRYITNITIKVLCNLVSQGINQEDSIFKTFENAVEIKFPRDSLIVATTEVQPPKEMDALGLGAPSNIGRQITSKVVLKKTFLIGGAPDSQYKIIHNLNSRDIIVIVRENFNDFSRVEVAIDYSDPNHIDIDMGDIIDTDSYSVTIMG